MSGRTSSPSEPSAAPLNTPFSVWSRQDRTHDVPEWVVEPKQLGWPEGTIAEAPNEDYDEDEDDDEEQEEKTTLTAKEHKIVCIRVAGGKRGNALIPRSNLPHELSATLYLAGPDGDAVIDHYENTFVYPEGIDRQPNGAKCQPRHPPAFSTADIAAAQDAAVLATEEAEVVRVLMGQSNLHRVGPFISKPALAAAAPSTTNAKRLSDEELEDLLTLPNSSLLPLETVGYLAGPASLDFASTGLTVEWDGSKNNTFRRFALDKISGLNPGNCDADLLAKIYDAMSKKEQQLAQEERLDGRGQPLTMAGDPYKNESTMVTQLEAWFSQAMMSVDRCVGRANGKKGSKGKARTKQMRRTAAPKRAEQDTTWFGRGAELRQDTYPDALFTLDDESSELGVLAGLAPVVFGAENVD